MKLRIQGNSVRFRLSQPDLARFLATRRIEELVNFPGATFGYSLESGDTETVQASFDSGALRVRIPAASVQEWASSEQEGITGEQSFEGKTLTLIVEKDFQCLHKEGDPEAFRNPMMSGDTAY
jgi:hypothetical protein